MKDMQRGFLSVNINTELLLRVIHAKKYFDADFSSNRLDKLKLSRTVVAIDSSNFKELVYSLSGSNSYSYSPAVVPVPLSISRTVYPVKRNTVSVINPSISSVV